MSWRVNVVEDSRDTSVSPVVGSVGASVIRCGRGGQTPIKIFAGEKQRLLNIFGLPSADYPDIWDMIEYNKFRDIWVSAPSLNSVYGGSFLTAAGTVAFSVGLSSKTSLDFTALPAREAFGTGDGTTTAFSLTLGDYSKYVDMSIDILVDGVSATVTASDVATEVLTTTPDVGSGTLVRTTGVLDFTFTVAPVLDTKIEVVYTINYATTAYAILFNKNPQVDDVSVQATYANDQFTINSYFKNADGTYDTMPLSPYSASLAIGGKDGFGTPIYIEDVFENDDYITAVHNTSLTFTTFTDDTAKVDFAGGSRGDTITSVELGLGWDEFQDKATYPADIFFDCTADSSIPAKFVTLRSTYQLYKAYLLPLPMEDVTAAISTKDGYSLDDRGIYPYWNWALVANNYSGGSFNSPMMGLVAKKHAQMDDIYNGLAPSWVDENNHGGQLKSSEITKVYYSPTESQLEALDTAQINAIIADPAYGYTITSHRTSKLIYGDYAFIEHSRVADYVIDNILNLVLPMQYTKPNDELHRRNISALTNRIVAPLASAGLLREYAIQCDRFNNTDSVLAQRKFILKVVVKFTPTSEKLTLVFQNIDQTASVSEFIG